MCSDSNNGALVDHRDGVCVYDGGQSVRNNNGRSAFSELAKCELHVVFTLCIERTRSLIKQEDFRVL